MIFFSRTATGWSGSGKLVFPFLGAKSHMRSPQDRLNIQVWLFQVRFRLAVLETARGRLRAPSYGFKASLWFECIALSDLNNIFKLICKLKKGGVKSIFTIESHAMYLSRPPDALKSLIRLYVGLRTGYDLGYIAFWVEYGHFWKRQGVLQGPLPCSGFILYLHFAGGKASAGPLLYKP